LVESFFGVHHLWQNGYKNVIALFGKEIFENQVRELLKVTNKFTLFLDGDEPGQLATEKIAAELINSGFVRIIKYPEGAKIKPAHFSGKNLKQLLHQ
jgi:DNA primase